METKVETIPLPEWQEWFRELLRTFRKTYLSLPLGEKDQITSRAAQGQPQFSPVFVSPSQLLVVWIRDEELDKDLQLLILTRFTDEPDGWVDVYGPFPPKQFLEVTSPIFEQPRWNHPWRPAIPIRKVVEERLVESSKYFSDHFRPQAQGELPRGGCGSSWGNFGICWICFVDIRKHDQASLIQDLLSLMQPPSKASTAPQPTQTKAFGSYTYEPIWVGDQPVPTYEQRLHGYELPSGFWHRSWRVPFLGTHLIAWRDGLIAIESEREDTALHLLNGFMAVASLLGLPTTAISGRNLVPMDLQPGTTNATTWGTGLYSPTAVMIQQRFLPTTPPVQRRWVLSEGDFNRLVEKTQALLKEERLTELLLLYLYGNTFVKRLEEFTAAFIFGWTIIERHLYDQLQLLPLGAQRK